MNKRELADYLVNLIVIMEAKEDVGLPKGTTLVDEYERCYKQLRDILEKEKFNETRQREFELRPSETRTPRAFDQPSGGSPAGGNGGASEGGGTDVLRKRL